MKVNIYLHIVETVYFCMNPGSEFGKSDYKFKLRARARERAKHYLKTLDTDLKQL